MRSRKIPLDKIDLGANAQPRAKIDQSTVFEYKELMREGIVFPPVVVFYDGKIYWLADGFHRRHAAQRAGIKKLACEVHQGTREDARWYSYSANQAHGLRRTNADKQRAVISALKHPNGAKMSNNAIAEHVGVSHPFVGKLRAELTATCNGYKSDTRTGRDGRTTDISNIGGKLTDETDEPKDPPPPKDSPKEENDEDPPDSDPDENLTAKQQKQLDVLLKDFQIWLDKRRTKSDRIIWESFRDQAMVLF